MQQENRVGKHEYRDDRKFVMNLHPCGRGRWELITYQNTGLLPSVRSDDFDDFDEAERYVRKWEPTVPLISLGERAMNLDHLESVEARYISFAKWLDERGLFGTLRLYRHCPYWHDVRGWSEKRASVKARNKTRLVDGVEVEIVETKFPLREQ